MAGEQAVGCIVSRAQSGPAKKLPFPHPLLLCRTVESVCRVRGSIRSVKEERFVTERRRHRRIALEVEVTVRTENALIPGRSQEMSEVGMSAIVPVELTTGQSVELQIKLPRGTVTTRAVVRHRNVFRHGFEFEQPLPAIVANE